MSVTPKTKISIKQVNSSKSSPISEDWIKPSFDDINVDSTFQLGESFKNVLLKEKNEYDTRRHEDFSVENNLVILRTTDADLVLSVSSLTSCCIRYPG